MRFNYLRSAQPSLCHQWLASRPPKHWRRPWFVAALAAIAVLLGWFLPASRPPFAPKHEVARAREHRQMMNGDPPVALARPAGLAIHQSLPRPRVHVIAMPLQRRQRQSSAAKIARYSAIRAVAPAEKVLGVSVGEKPQAIVRLGGRTRIVTVGDMVAGRRIVAIGLAEIWLRDGPPRRIAIAR